MEGGDDLFTQKLDRPHCVLVLHGAFVSVDVNVSRPQAVDALRELPGNGLWAADYDIVDRLQFIVGRRVTELRGSSAEGRAGPFYLNSAAGLVARRIIVLSGPFLAVVGRPHELAANLYGLLIGVGH